MTIPIVPNVPFFGVKTFTVTLSNPSPGVVLYVPACTVNIGSAGTLDTSFASDFVDNAVYKTVLQPDGKLLIGGAFSVPNKGFARLNPNGTVDTAFGIGGGVDTLPVFALALQPDGNILVGGKFAKIGGTAMNSLARLGGGGGLDTTFNVGTGSTGEVYDFTMQSDGRAILGAGFGIIQGTPDLTVARIFTSPPALPGRVQLSAATVAGAEGTSLTLTATRTGGSYGAITMNFATQPGTAALTRYTPVTGTLSWADGDAASKTITVPLLNDAIVQPNQTFALNLGIPIGGLSNSAPWQTTVTVTSAAPIDLWSLNQFTPDELLDPSISGDNADLNHNGISTLLDYAFGLDPKVASASGLPTTAIQTIDGLKYLTLTFRRSPTATDLTYTPQSGDTINVWNGTPVQVGTAIPNADGTETVTFRDSVPITGATSQRFIRLQVTRTP